MVPSVNTARMKGSRASCPRMVVARRPVVDGRHSSRKDMRCCHDLTGHAHIVAFQKGAAVRLLLKALQSAVHAQLKTRT